MPLFRYDPELLERFPATVGGLVHATGVTNGPSPPPLAAAYRAEQGLTLERIGKQSPAAVPSLAAWRRAFSAFGVEPTRYRSAAESLLRRLTKHGDVPSVGLLVDVGNLVSLRYGLPVAVFDLEGVDGGITVRFAEGDEEYTDLAGRTVEHPEPGEVIFVDEAGAVHARRWCWRQSAQSATGPATTEVLITAEGQHETACEDVSAALDDLERLLAQHLPASRLARGLLAPEG